MNYTTFTINIGGTSTNIDMTSNEKIIGKFLSLPINSQNSLIHYANGLLNTCKNLTKDSRVNRVLSEAIISGAAMENRARK